MRSRAFLAALIASLAAPGAARAQETAPDRGPALVVAGEVTGTLAPDDDGYFNETDYGHNVLRQLRLVATARWQPHRAVALVAEARSFDMERPELQALFLRLHPWRAHAVDLQAGRIPPVFGTFARRSYAPDNPLIGYPLAYQYLTALRPDALPASARELQRMRGRGWLPRFSVGEDEDRAGLPLVSALQFDTGLQLRAARGPVEAAVAVTQGTLGNPRVEDDNGGKQVSGRLLWRPAPSWVIGASAARGAYLADALTASVPSVDADRHHQTAWGADLEFSRGLWLARAEVLRSSWQLPALAPPEPRSPVTATAASLEARYRLTPALALAVRGEHLGFTGLSDAAVAFPEGTSWEAPVWRVEAAAGYAVTRRLRLRAAYQHNWRDGGFVREEGLVAGQVSWRF